MVASKQSSLAGIALAAALLSAPGASESKCLAAQPPTATGTNLINSDGWTLLQPTIGSATYSTIRDTGPDGSLTRVLQVQVNTPAPLIYNIQLTQDIAAAVPADHLMRYHFWARSATPHQMRAVVEGNSAPYPRYLGSDSLTLTPRWKEYSFTDDSPGLAAGAAGARLQVGLQPGVVEIAGAQVQDLGVDPTVERDQAALEPAAIQARIRKYRMADLTIRVVDSRGRPVPNTRIAVRQQRHAFLFGCNIFGLRDIDTSSSTPADWQSQQAYRAAFTGLFNYATLPFYWGAFEPQPGQADFPRLSWMAEWCQQRGITTKAHPLVWQQVYPAWAPITPDQTIPLLHKRVVSIVDNMSGLSSYYDVINETMAAPAYSPPNGESLWVARDGAASVTATVLGWARGAARADNTPDDHFIVNDYIVDDSYADLFRQLRSRHSLPDAIGIQSHMHSGVWPMRRVWDTCERFAPFGIPIHFTETTVLSTLTPHTVDSNAPPAADWPTTPEGEAAQADYVAQFYTILFSHPSVHAITWWDLSDSGAWMGAPAGLLRKDMTPKPAYARLFSLIKHAWWTNANGLSNSQGRYVAHAFYGDYTVRVTDARGRSVTVNTLMPEASGPKSVTVQLP